MKIKSQRDFLSGLLFIVIGAAFAWAASTGYPIGQAARMGPGYFPLLLGIVLAGLGTLIVFGALVVETEDGEPIGPWPWGPLCCITAANLLFGALLGGLPGLRLPPMGIVAAVVALAVVASFAADRVAWKEVAVLSTVLAAGCWFIFVVVLGLELPLWPAFLAR